MAGANYLSLYLIIPLLSSAVTAFSPNNPSSCAAILCPVGSICKVETTFCFTTPCPGPTARCVPRISDKPGSCPVQSPVTGICSVRCTSDADCGGNLKCCGNCPRQCTSPALPRDKPGVCPRNRNSNRNRNRNRNRNQFRFRFQFCRRRHRCSNDFDCRGFSKCCGTCPRRCVSPFAFFRSSRSSKSDNDR